MGDLLGYLIGGILALAGILWGTISARNSSKKVADAQSKVETAERNAAQTAELLRTVKGKQDVENSNSNLSADERRKRLRDEYAER